MIVRVAGRSNFFANAAEMHQRKVFVLWSAAMLGAEYNGKEYRGRRADGTCFRFVGVFEETVQYERVTKEAAEALDRVIDSVCWRTEG